MNTIDITLKGSPLSLSVQRKELDDAEALYQKIVQAMNSTSPQVLELTSDREPEKKIGVLSSEISAVQMVESGTTPGRAGGFLGLGSS